jgi:DNA-binding transcriptional regulator YdaS (Cro superfamily)
MVSQWASGQKPVAVPRCAVIERATGGAVRRWDLRPDDWHEIWPELIGTEGAPPVPAEARHAA